MKRHDGQRIFVFSDMQYPFVNWYLFNLCLNFISDYQPTRIIFIGDQLDFPAVTTKYTIPSPLVGSTLDDVEGFKCEVLEPLRAITKVPIWWTLGNHEMRFRRYLDQNASEVAALHSLNYSKLFEASKYKLRITDDHFEICYNTIVTHSEICRKKSGYTAWGNLDKWGKSVVHGHTHRAGLIFHTDAGRDIFAMEVGHLIDIDRMRKELGWFKGVPDWQTAFGIIEAKGRHVQPTLIKCSSTGFYINGKRYR